MRRFEKWRDPDADPAGAEAPHSVGGTPLGSRGEGFEEFMSGVPGFVPGSDAYVYVAVLVRKRDASRWYCVGETTHGEEGLAARLEEHVRGKTTKPVRRGGLDVLDSPLPGDTTDAYVAVGVERVEPVAVDREAFLKPRAMERARELAYEVAIEHDTTRVLGGA